MKYQENRSRERPRRLHWYGAIAARSTCKRAQLWARGEGSAVRPGKGVCRASRRQRRPGRIIRMAAAGGPGAPPAGTGV